jgi:hypothetical protein
MNAAAIYHSFGPSDISSIMTLERMSRSSSRSGLAAHLTPGNRFYGGGRLQSISFAEALYPHPVQRQAPVMRHFGGEIKPTSIAESLKGLAVNASSSLSPHLRQRISELAALESNWDGEGAKPVKPHVLADAVETLKRLSLLGAAFREPFIAPMFDGFVQLEWHSDKRSLDIEAVDKGWSAVGTLIGAGGNRHYYTGEFERNDFARIANFYQWILGEELIWPSL